MNVRERREFLQIEALETNRLLELTGDHPLMAPALQQRREEIERELSELPAPSVQPRTVLFFAGGPVVGTRGIDAQFAATMIGHFDQIWTTVRNRDSEHFTREIEAHAGSV